ncbi:MAG: type II secretion system protein [Nitrospirae bacterium]|nr:type II secretion system protein [Nitrospirota bacterium]
MRNSGFTLLEVIIAIAIMGISVVLVMQLFSGGLRSGKTAADYTMAVIHAREKMEEMLTDPSVGTGDFGDGYRWQAEAAHYSPGEKEDSELLKITVKVSWPEKNRAVELVTLKAASKEELR